MKKIKRSTIVGVIFAITALVLGIISATRIDINIRLESYFSLTYLMQFTPLIISLMLFISGYGLIKRMPKANFYLALFGSDMLEEALFDWFGLINSSLETYTLLLFFLFALSALWIAYSNVFDLKSLSLKEAVLSIVLGTLISLSPYFV